MLIKEYAQEEVRCLDCNSLTLARHEDIPEKGIYDKTIQSLVNYFRFRARLPYNRLVDVMKNIFFVSIQPKITVKGFPVMIPAVLGGKSE